MRKSLNAVWAAKLLRTKSFVVLTDTESVIRLDGMDPNKFETLLALTAQKRALVVFHKRLGALIKAHDKAADKLEGTNTRSPRVPKNSRKIPVKRG